METSTHCQSCGELQNVVRGVRYSSCPIFPYNSLLCLLLNLEIVVIEGPGTRLA